MRAVLVWVHPAICGLAITVSSCNSGWSGDGGSCSQTSIPAPPRWPDASAAANAMSDLYAMGAEPLFGINLVGFPDDMDTAVLTEILRGGAEKVREAGAVVAGGHTTSDKEPKYGLAVVGIGHLGKIHARIWRENNGHGPSLYFEDPNGHKLEVHASDLESRVKIAGERQWEGIELFE